MNIEEVQQAVTHFYEDYTTEVAELKEKYAKLNLLIEENKESAFVQKFFKKSFTIGNSKLFEDVTSNLTDGYESEDFDYLESYGIEDAEELEEDEVEDMIYATATDIVADFISDFSHDVNYYSDVYGFTPTIQEQGEDVDLNIFFDLNEGVPEVDSVCRAIEEDSNREIDFKKDVIEKYNLTFDFPEAPLTQENMNQFMNAYKGADVIKASLVTAKEEIQKRIDFLEGIKKLDAYLTTFDTDFYNSYNDYELNGWLIKRKSVA